MRKLLPFITICFLGIILFSCQTETPIQPEPGFIGESLLNSGLELPNPYNPEAPENWTKVQNEETEAVLTWEKESGNYAISIQSDKPLEEIHGWFQSVRISDITKGSVFHFTADVNMEGLSGAGVILQIDGMGRTVETYIPHNVDGGGSCGGSRVKEQTKVISTLEFTESLLIQANGSSKKSGFQTFEFSFIAPENIDEVKALEVNLSMLPSTQGKVIFDNISCMVSTE